MADFWLRLYRALRKDRWVSNGPTIPFLIGAYRIRFGNHEFSIEDFLSVLRAGPEHSRIMYCNDTDAYILTVDDYFNYHNPDMPSGPEGYLSYCADLTSTKNAIAVLTKEYESWLQTSQFSWERGKIPPWQEFDNEQISFIMKI